MPTKLLPLVLRNLFRSKTRFLATTGCCVIAAVIISFFLTAQHSFTQITEASRSNETLVMSVRDSY